jgi:hypothetical protein
MRRFKNLDIPLFQNIISVNLGYFSIFSIVAASGLFCINRIYPIQGKYRMRIHCTLGFLGLFGAVLNISFGSEAPKMINNVSVGLIVLIIATGIILKYIKSAGNLRYQSSTIHPITVFSLLILMFYYWLVNKGIL